MDFKPPVSRARLLRMTLALAASLAVAASAAAADAPAPASRLKVIGYVMDGPVLPPISARKLDAINFAFALVDPEGEVYLPGRTAAGALAGLVALRDDTPDLKVLASIGGWGADHFSEAALTPASRARFAESAARLAREHRLDGIDIDWEYPTLPGPGISHRPEDRENFSLLLETVREHLDALGREQGRHYLLTIAAADGEAARGLELARIVRVLDWINLMTYDFYGSLGPRTGHHAALDRSRLAPADARTTVQAVDEFLAAGVPARKLNVGVAFYGRAFAQVEPAHNGVHQPYGRYADSLAWHQVRDLPGRDGYVRHWDAQAQAPYLWNPATRTFVTYDDPQSLAAKAAFVRARGLGGLMYWEHRHDVDDQLLDALREGLDAAGPASPAPAGRAGGR
ncbi:chitinase [Pseudoxanthomonas broegbernensis]|uniref:chitinase n=1 Tax=Pseudoxanthomonas broegbernensis TaxID=83619 RepID=A0A7V8K7I4_9GAMM|nr:glycoside hydrolase family 18 protein [Pseudoxanthomonas broegbernensis]KAF1686932.1 chitinase [Pseudoxanthomonas broegbernensis]MBB6065469.1 chitinase [Pseudoxanthomonas broegbernensis]